MAKTPARKGQKRRPSRKQAKGGMWHWYLAGALSIGGAVAYDHRAEWMPMAEPFYTASIAKPQPVEKRADTRTARKAETAAVKAKPALALPMPGVRPVEMAALDDADRKPVGRKPGQFYFCTVTLENCVVDGDTFWYGKRKIAIADIVAPSIKQAKCEDERKLGSLAKKRLWEMLNSGEVQVASSDGSSSARVTVGGRRSIGDVLLSEGLARRKSSGSGSWCAKG